VLFGFRIFWPVTTSIHEQREVFFDPRAWGRSNRRSGAPIPSL